MEIELTIKIKHLKVLDKHTGNILDVNEQSWDIKGLSELNSQYLYRLEETFKNALKRLDKTISTEQEKP